MLSIVRLRTPGKVSALAISTIGLTRLVKKVAGVINEKKLGIYNAGFYNIVSVETKTERGRERQFLTLKTEDDDGEQGVLKTNVGAHLVEPRYATTVYRYQGKSIDEPANIVGLKHARDRNEVYTALSRFRKLDNIHLSYTDRVFEFAQESLEPTPVKLKEVKTIGSVYRLHYLDGEGQHHLYVGQTILANPSERGLQHFKTPVGEKTAQSDIRMRKVQADFALWNFDVLCHVYCAKENDRALTTAERHYINAERRRFERAHPQQVVCYNRKDVEKDVVLNTAKEEASEAFVDAAVRYWDSVVPAPTHTNATGKRKEKWHLRYYTSLFGDTPVKRIQKRFDSEQEALEARSKLIQDLVFGRVRRNFVRVDDDEFHTVFHIDDAQEIGDKFLNLPPDLDDILTEDNPHGVAGVVGVVVADDELDDELDDDWL